MPHLNIFSDPQRKEHKRCPTGVVWGCGAAWEKPYSLPGPGFQIPGDVDCRERKRIRIRFEIWPLYTCYLFLAHQSINCSVYQKHYHSYQNKKGTPMMAHPSTREIKMNIYIKCRKNCLLLHKNSYIQTCITRYFTAETYPKYSYVVAMCCLVCMPVSGAWFCSRGGCGGSSGAGRSSFSPQSLARLCRTQQATVTFATLSGFMRTCTIQFIDNYWLNIWC